MKKIATFCSFAVGIHSYVVHANSEAADSSKNIDEVEVIVVHGDRNNQDIMTAVPTTILTAEKLENRRLGGLGETLAGLPGIHLDNYGGGASRPVIRGQTLPRVQILSEGANLFDVSSVSPDHAITAEPLLLDGIEVLRGASAARFGGNAISGVVNLLDSRVPKSLPEGRLKGALEARLGSGDEEKSIAGRLTTSVDDFAFHLEGFSRSAEDYAVPDEFGSSKLKDSFSDASGFSLGSSWITNKGYIGAAYSRQDNEYGLPGHTHRNAVCHTHGLDLHCVAHGSYEDPFGTPDHHTAKIKLTSERFDIRADYSNIFPGIEHTRLRLSYTDYNHDEIDGELIFTQYVNEVYDSRIELTHKPIGGFTGTFGVQYTDGEFAGLNVNNAHRPQILPNWEGFVSHPNFLTDNKAIFLNERREFGALEVAFSMRKDWRSNDITIPEYYFTYDQEASEFFAWYYGDNWQEVVTNEAVEKLRADQPKTKYQPLSASLGATWSIKDEYSLALSVAHSERAPNVRELYAKGNNLATNSWEVGLVTRTRWHEFYAKYNYPESNFDLESNNSVNLTLRKHQGETQFEFSVFHQDVSNYIFARSHEVETETGLPHKYLFYVGADATFSGFEGQISQQITDTISGVLFGDYVSTDLSGQESVSADLNGANDKLPRIPPARLGSRLEWQSGDWFAEFEFYHTFKQDEVASYETETAGYNMVNATATYQFNGSLEIFLRGTNLLDELALVHTSFVKEQSPMRGRNLVFGIRTNF